MKGIRVHVPQRMCVVCRVRQVKHSLFRFVPHVSQIRWDASQVLSGRGVYCCRDCLNLVKTKKSPNWQRLFRVQSDERTSLYNELERVLSKLEKNE